MGNYKQFINGESVYLREVRLTDVNENYYNWLADPEVNQYLEVRTRPQSINDIAEYVEKMRQNPNEFLFAIIDKKTDKHIGNVKLGPVNWIHRNSDMALFIGEKDFWGKGLGTEVIKLVVEFAFKTLNLHKVTAGIYKNNIGSYNAFIKAGFSQEALLKSHYYFDGEYIDAYRMGIIKS